MPFAATTCSKASQRLKSLLIPFFAGGAALILLSGCSSIVNSSTQKADFVASYTAGNFAGAALYSSQKAKDRAWTGDGLMWMLEAGKCEFSAGRYTRSLDEFEAAEERMEDYDSRPDLNLRAMSYEGASAATNQNALPYEGNYVDRTMLNAYKALSYFALERPEDALVEIRRMNFRQNTQEASCVPSGIALVAAASPTDHVENFTAEKSNAFVRTAMQAITMIMNPIQIACQSSLPQKSGVFFTVSI